MRLYLCSLMMAWSAGIAAMPAGAADDPDLAQAWPAWLVGDHVEARRHFLAAARRGHPLGQYNLAMMVLHGEGGPRRPAEARVLLCRAAAAGYERAARELMRWQRTQRPCPVPKAQVDASAMSRL